MGNIRVSPLADLALSLRNEHQIVNFVETGTYQGETAAWAAQHFARVVTVEASPHYYQLAAQRRAALPGVEFRFGHSAPVLREVVPTLDGPALFWLDAHWSAGETYGAGDECPLLDELSAIVQRKAPNYILIDDAAYFTAPPPLPHDPAQWPGLAEIAAVLNGAAAPTYVAIFCDVIVALPRASTAAFVTFHRYHRPAPAHPQPRQRSGVRGLYRRAVRLVRPSYRP